MTVVVVALAAALCWVWFQVLDLKEGIQDPVLLDLREPCMVCEGARPGCSGCAGRGWVPTEHGQAILDLVEDYRRADPAA